MPARQNSWIALMLCSSEGVVLAKGEVRFENNRLRQRH